ncbi:hypothetical protein ACFVQ0_37025 [Streptomyces sp. NPDC057900]
MSWKTRVAAALTSSEPEPQCPPNCQKCTESASIDPDYTPTEEQS